MKSEKVIDLKQQLIGLFDKENMLAFFDFHLPLDQNESVQGLCKIAVPKEGEAKSKYLSLLFIIDTIDDAVAEKVDSHLRGISWSGHKNCLRGSTMIIPMPHVSYEARHYIQEVEIYLSPHTKVSRSYIVDEFYPAILKILGCRGNELIFWDERPRNKKHLEIADVHMGSDHSLIEQIIGYFTGA